MPIKREIRRLPTRQNITEVKFTGSNFSRKRINHEIERIRAKIPNKRIQVLLPYENWKPGSWFEDNDDISLFSLLDHYDESQLPVCGGDPGTYDRFIVYMTDPLESAGGCDPKNDNGLNDCLYRCLYQAYGTFSKLPKSIEKPEFLKQALDLERDEPVPVECIGKVEKLAGTIAINIVGNVTRISKSPAYRQVTLALANGHYSIVPNPDRRKITTAINKPKKPLIYCENGVNDTVAIFDGKSVRSIDMIELYKFKSPFGKHCCIPVAKDNTGVYEKLDEAYKRVHEERNILLEESKKLGLPIDLFMCCGSYKKVALWLFEKLSQSIPANESLNPTEAKWISDTMMGGIIWAKNDWKGFGRQYDETSLYPSIMQSALTFPIGKGKFQSVKDFVKKHQNKDYAIYGIFRAEVEYKDDMKALFRYNKNKKYTHIDLLYARELGLQVALIQDDTPNALIYEMEARIPGKVIFGEYVNFLFKLKNAGGTVGRIAKRILNTLWGALCQRNKFYYDINNDMSGLFKNPEGEILDTITPMGNNRWTLQFSNPGNLFKGEYPRIAPFILSQGRKIVSNQIRPYKDIVRRIHTDGFILEEDPEKLPIIECPENASKTLKTLKFEKEGNCYVKNANQVAWH